MRHAQKSAYRLDSTKSQTKPTTNLCENDESLNAICSDSFIMISYYKSILKVTSNQQFCNDETVIFKLKTTITCFRDLSIDFVKLKLLNKLFMV